MNIMKPRIDNSMKHTSHEFFSVCLKNDLKRVFSYARHHTKSISETERFGILWDLQELVVCEETIQSPRAKGMTCATYVIKTFSLLNVKSPFELMSEEKSRVKDFKVFGSPCYVHVLASQKASLMLKQESIVHQL